MSSILFTRPQFEAVMIRIPKTGSTSIVRGIFGGIGEGDSVVHGAPLAAWDKYFKFAFVRNPFDRLVSAFLMFKNYPTETDAEKTFKESMTIRDVLNVIEDERQPLDREDYFSKLRKHAIPMTHPFFGLSKAEKVYRFESFESAYLELSHRFQINVEEIPHFRKSDRKHYSDYFDRNDRARAEAIFKSDCETFGYHY